MLPLPSIEVLAEAAENPGRRGAVLHVLETTVIGWIKQIKVTPCLRCLLHFAVIYLFDNDRSECCLNAYSIRRKTVHR